MRHGKIRPISTAPLRLPPAVMRQAEGLARSAGVGVAELIDLLLQGLLEAEAGQIIPPPAPVLAQRRGAPRQTARILVMDDFRRRTASGQPDTDAAEHQSIHARAASLRRRAARVRARSAREAAKRARETAQVALEERATSPWSAP